jgi:2-enoate reductase
LTIEEIEELVRDFEFSAKIICMADIDCIEIHGHQGYLLDEFLTALWNKRTDKYGGDLNGRLRLALELVEAVKRGAGQDYPVLYKYPLTHYLEGGRGIGEGLEIAKRLEAAGVAALTITGGCYETYNRTQPPTTQPRGCWVDLCEMTKRVVRIPIVTSGKLGYPDLAEKILQEGKGDFIGLCRYLLADPEWANKVREGRREDIVPCVGCHEGCIARVRKFQRIGCAVNPAAGAEKELTILRADRKKSVLVVGGGPAGLEAARVSALRGHKVTLWEKRERLGGNLIPAAVPDFKDDYKLLIQYLSTQIKKLGIKVELEKRATPGLIQRFRPDVVFVATGAQHLIPEIEEIDLWVEKGRVVTAVEALLGMREIGKSVVVAGAGLIGCETALHLAQKGRKVTIAGGRRLAHDMVWGNALDLIKLLDDHKVKILNNNRVIRITETGVDSAHQHFDADTVVLAVGMQSNNEIPLEALAGRIPEVYAIGDCVRPRHVMNAIWEGYRTAYVI